MPRLWDDTIAAHRQAVREAVLDTTWRLVDEHGLLDVTMSRIAQETGIGRATLYKYFADVEEILRAWHERHVEAHLAGLRELADQPHPPLDRLLAVLEAYATIRHRSGHLNSALSALLHHDHHTAQARGQLLNLIEDLLVEATNASQLRQDVPARELASYCLHALEAAGDLQSLRAVRRLVQVTLSGLRPQVPDAQQSPGERPSSEPADTARENSHSC